MADSRFPGRFGRRRNAGNPCVRVALRRRKRIASGGACSLAAGSCRSNGAIATLRESCFSRDISPGLTHPRRIISRLPAWPYQISARSSAWSVFPQSRPAHPSGNRRALATKSQSRPRSRGSVDRVLTYNTACFAVGISPLRGSRPGYSSGTGSSLHLSTMRTWSPSRFRKQ